MQDVDVPHLAYPFAFVSNDDGTVSAAVVEQDTADELLSCVNALVSCPLGFRDESPAFGVPPVEFAQAPVDATSIVAAINRWEPRAIVQTDEIADASSNAWRHVLIYVAAPADSTSDVPLPGGAPDDSSSFFEPSDFTP